eukprot:scaffold357387_cov37-Prasinocladus_malaysianus.AAC.1
MSLIRDSLVSLEQNWDHAAGIVCVTEAGGKVTDLHGEPLPMGPGKDFVPGRARTQPHNILIRFGSLHLCADDLADLH